MPELPTSTTTMTLGEESEKARPTEARPTFFEDLESLLGLTMNAAARSVDYLLVHEHSFQHIDHLTQFHSALTQVREQLRQFTKLTNKHKQTLSADTPKGKSMESADSTEAQASMGNTEGATPGDQVGHGQPGDSVGEDTSSVQPSDNTLQLFPDNREEAVPLAGMWSQLFDMTKEQKRGANCTSGSDVEPREQESGCEAREARVSEAAEAIPQLRVDELQEGHGIDSTANLRPLSTLVRLMGRLAPTIVEIGSHLDAMLAAAKAEERELTENSGVKASRPITNWCTCDQHIEEHAETTTTRANLVTNEENDSSDPMVNHLRKKLRVYEAFDTRISEEPGLRKEIIETIAIKSEGIETVANIHLARVSRTLTAQGVREVLFALPKGSADTYALVMRGIEKYKPLDSKLLHKALRWLCNSLRPLTVSELLHVLNPDLSYKVDMVGHFTEKIKSLCGALFELGPSSEVVCIDPSVKEYLQSNYAGVWSDVHWSMAHDCIEYFNLPEFAKGRVECPQKRIERFPFLEYAAHNWALHCQRVGPDKAKQVRRVILKFFSKTNSTSSAIQVIQARTWGKNWAAANGQLSGSKSQASRRVLAAAVFKLNDIVIEQLNVRGSQLCNCTDRQGQSLLSIAAENDNLVLVRTLLSRSDIAADAEDKGGRTPLLWAAACGASTELLKLFLDRDDVKPNARNSLGQTPLSWAASEGHLHVVKLLLDKTPVVDPNNKEDDESTPLALAAKNGHLEVVCVLLDHPGTDLEKAGEVLGGAARNGHVEIVKLLVQRGVAINRCDELGLTPLAHAAKNGHLPVVKALLEIEGIDADSRDNDLKTPLILAAKVGEREVVETLLSRPDVDPDAQDNFDRTALSWACKENFLDIARMLLKTGKVDVNSRERSQREYTPLHTAAYLGHYQICELLLEQPNIQPDLPEIRANTPLMTAVWKGHRKIVKLLLDHKDVAPDKKGEEQRTPLMMAAASGWKNIVKMLLERAPEDVDINAVDVLRHTALWLASCNGSHEIVQLLLAQPNINVNVRDSAGNTALGIAIDHSFPEVVKLLLSREDVNLDEAYGRNLRTPLGWAICAGLTEIVDILLKTGKVNINYQDDLGHTPLMLAIRSMTRASNGESELPNRLLVCEGIDVTLHDFEGRAAISFAAQSGNLETIEAILNPSKPWVGKVDVDGRDAFQRTPLWWAANANKPAIVKYLLETGKVTADAQDNHGTTPLCIAVWNGYIEVVKLLLWHPDVNPGQKDHDGDSVLACATAVGGEIFELLLTHPLVDPEERNFLGRTTLGSAVTATNWMVFKDIFAMLLAYRGTPPLNNPDVRYIDVEARDNEGQTPFSIACADGAIEVVALMLDYVDLNTRSNSGRTPLSYAAENAKHMVVRCLLERDDVDCFIKDNDGHTAMWWAKRAQGAAGHAEHVREYFGYWKPGHP